MSTATMPDMDPHRAMMVARKKRSAVWRFIHFLGSLKLALILLATIAIACAVATFYESSFNSKVAQAYIYKSPFFIIWLGVLCLNLFAVTLTRWPWQRRHFGFVITHYGIITLLIGAVIGSWFGFEGNVTLHRNDKPIDRIVMNRSVIQLENPVTRKFTLKPFDVAVRRPSEDHPVTIPIPSSPLKLVADAYSESLVVREQLISSNQPDAVAGVSLDFSSVMMGQQLSLALLMNSDRDFFGLARLALLPLLPKRIPSMVQETQMVFAKFAPVLQSDGGATGVTVKLSMDGEILTIGTPFLASQKYRRVDIAGKTLRIGDANLEIKGYWPDFKIIHGEPASVSTQPNNPALLVRITGPAHSSNTEKQAQPLLELAPVNGGLAYQLSRAGQVYLNGFAKLGESFPLGWADWRATITKLQSKAALKEVIEPGSSNFAHASGFLARLVDPNGCKGPAQWIQSGKLTSLKWQDTNVRIGYGLELRQIPFTINLKSFEVPRVEGTETPSNFIATIEFKDSKTGVVKEGVASMNHPASWPGTAFAIMTGWNYKFSQAEWNPEDLEQTTLQVLYDPGWLFKWTGSLAICLGIFTMFYLRPKKL